VAKFSLLYNAANLTADDVFQAFHRSPAEVRWLAAADSLEYLALLAYLVKKGHAPKAQP
jgi:hypothetical protein